MTRAPDEPSSSPREAALFDLAVNRAASYLRRTGALTDPVDRGCVERALRTWARSTRFAYRVDLADVATCMAKRGAQEGHWAGGKRGRWSSGRPNVP